MQLHCSSMNSTVLADAWVQSGLAHSLPNHNEEEDADAYLLLDQDQAVRLAEAYEGGFLQMQPEYDGSFSNQALEAWIDGEICTDPGTSRLAEQQNSRKGQAVSAGSKSSRANGRKCTTLAQREAHKRYREKKKQNIAAMEAEVQVKRNELQQLQAENEALKSRARVLETAERCSEEIHELMKLLDGLQSLGDKAELVEGGQAGHECYSSRPRSSGSNLDLAASAEGSSQRALDGVSANTAAAAPAAKPATGVAAPAVNLPCSSTLHSGSDSTFLRTLMRSTDSVQQQQEPAAVCIIKQEQPESAQPTRLSLQDEAHWLQLAQQYLDMQDCQQQVQDNQPSFEPPHLQPFQATTGPTAPTPVSDGVGATCSAAAGAADASGERRHTCQASSVSNVSPSSTAESGSSVLADLGSVDTAEQGLVIYKAFLQKASEMLALAQQQQLQADLDAAAATEQQLGEFTRNTISRLQPFLVARGQGVVYEWNTRNLETLQPEEPPATLWPAVLDALQLTSEVQRDALQCFELFGASLTRLLEERAQLAQQYRQLQSRSTSGSCSSEEADVATSIVTARTLEAVAEPLFSSMAMLRALAANLERYQSLDGVFAHSLTNLLTGAQIAAACVASYPYLPRWHTMMSTLKQRVEEEQQLQQQGGLLHDGLSPSKQPQRRSSRVRTATKVAQEAAYV